MSKTKQIRLNHLPRGTCPSEVIWLAQWRSADGEFRESQPYFSRDSALNLASAILEENAVKNDVVFIEWVRHGGYNEQAR